MKFFIFLVSFFMMIGCDSVTNSPDVKVVLDSVTGHINVSNGVSLSGVKIGFGNTVIRPNSFGDYTIYKYDTIKNAAGRIASNDTVAYIIIGTDTLKEVYINSWNSVLPDNYIVQRNISSWSDRSAFEAVYWTNDSVANVLEMSVGGNNKVSTFIYIAYNDNDFKTNKTIFNIFVRAKSGGEVTKNTNILQVKAKSGDIVFDSSDFEKFDRFSFKKIVKIQNDSIVSNYNGFDSLKLTNVNTVENNDTSGSFLSIYTKTYFFMGLVRTVGDTTYGDSVIVNQTTFDSVEVEGDISDSVVCEYAKDIYTSNHIYENYNENTVDMEKTIYAGKMRIKVRFKSLVGMVSLQYYNKGEMSNITSFKVYKSNKTFTYK